MDPLGENYYSLSAYNYVANNPIMLIDPNGRSIQFSGSFEESWKIILALTKMFDAGSMKINFTKDNEGKITGFISSEFKLEEGEGNEMSQYLADVVNDKEMFSIKKVKTTPKKIDEIERQGGMMMNKVDRTISIAEQFFTDDWSTFDAPTPGYSYIEKSNSIWHDNGEYKRRIPFEEAIAHEIIHTSRWYIRRIRVTMREEENAVRSILNSYREKKGYKKRGLLRRANIWEQLWGATEMEDLYEYDDY